MNIPSIRQRLLIFAVLILINNFWILKVAGDDILVIFNNSTFSKRSGCYDQTKQELLDFLKKNAELKPNSTIGFVVSNDDGNSSLDWQSNFTLNIRKLGQLIDGKNDISPLRDDKLVIFLKKYLDSKTEKMGQIDTIMFNPTEDLFEDRIVSPNSYGRTHIISTSEMNYHRQITQETGSGNVFLHIVRHKNDLRLMIYELEKVLLDKMTDAPGGKVMKLEDWINQTKSTSMPDLEDANTMKNEAGHLEQQVSVFSNTDTKNLGNNERTEEAFHNNNTGSTDTQLINLGDNAIKKLVLIILWLGISTYIVYIRNSYYKKQIKIQHYLNSNTKFPVIYYYLCLHLIKSDGTQLNDSGILDLHTANFDIALNIKDELKNIYINDLHLMNLTLVIEEMKRSIEPENHDFFMKHCIEVIIVDGRISFPEIEIIETLCQILDIPLQDFRNKFYQMSGILPPTPEDTSSIDYWKKINPPSNMLKSNDISENIKAQYLEKMNLPRHATVGEIKSRYHQLMSELQPQDNPIQSSKNCQIAEDLRKCYEVLVSHD